MNLNINVTSPGILSFYVKTSTWEDIDLFEFWKNGIKQEEWTGDIGWTQYQQLLLPGEHWFKWAYLKRSLPNVPGGVWLDCINFPAHEHIAVEPNQPVEPIPEVGSIMYPNDLEFDWASGGNTVSFLLSVGTDNPPTNILNQIPLDRSEYFPEVDFEYGTEYFWRVDAVNQDYTTTGEVWSFETVSPPFETFETGDFSLLPWESHGDTLFHIANLSVDDGNYCAATTVTETFESSTLSLSINVLEEGYFSFWWRLQDAPAYAMFVVSIDGTARLTGYSYQQYDWRLQIFTLDPGIHTLEWQAQNMDGTGIVTLYIDDIILPPHETGESVPFPAVPKWPPDEAAFVPCEGRFEWDCGSETDNYLFYLGTNHAANNMIDGESMTERFYQTASPLEYETTYYWRVDAVGQGGTTEGDLQSFTTSSAEVETFETGDFSKYPWELSGDILPAIVSSQPADGNYCVALGFNTTNLTNQFSVTLNCEEGYVSFYKRTNLVPFFMLLSFFIDGSRTGIWKDVTDWEEMRYYVSEGEHTFAWQFECTMAGADAYIDYISFPPLKPQLEVVPTALAAEVEAGQSTQMALTLYNTGSGDLDFTIEHDNTRRRASGGPDSFGYIWKDSDDPEGPAYNWIDILNYANDTAIDGNDQIFGPIDMSFSFPFYGENYGQIYVSSNGWISLHSTSETAPLNRTMPNDTEPNALIAPLWDDLRATQDGTVVYLDDMDNGRFIVTWNEIQRLIGGGTYTFQAILHDDGRIVYQYNSLTGDVESCTVGIENAEGDVGLQVAYNEPYLHDELAVSLGSDEMLNWLQYTPNSGTIAMGDNVEISITFDASLLGEGIYSKHLVIESNDPENPEITVDVTMTVTEPTGPPDAPQNVMIWIAEGNVNLIWNSVSGASTYHIYRKETPEGIFNEIGTTSQTTWNEIIPDGNHWFYRITAE